MLKKLLLSLLILLSLFVLASCGDMNFPAGKAYMTGDVGASSGS